MGKLTQSNESHECKLHLLGKQRAVLRGRQGHDSDATQVTFPSRRSRSPPTSVLIISGNTVTSHVALFYSFLTP